MEDQQWQLDNFHNLFPESEDPLFLNKLLYETSFFKLLRKQNDKELKILLFYDFKKNTLFHDMD